MTSSQDNNRHGVWIPGPRRGARPGMTTVSFAKRSPLLTIFCHCSFTRFSSRTGSGQGPGNEPSTVLAEDSRSQGSGNADSQRKVWSSGWGGLGRPCPSDSGCVPAHPPYWRASASYRPLRAVWAVCAWALRGCVRSKEPFSARKKQRTTQKEFADDHRQQVRQGPRNHIRHHLA